VADRLDAVVVGSGPNGLCAALRMAQAGGSVLVLEAEDQIGGGTRTAELTLAGYRHDVCSAIHPFAVASPYLSRLPLGEHGLEWIHPEVAVAHPLDDGPAVLLERSMAATGETFDPVDRVAWERLVGATVADWDTVVAQFLGPALRPPRHPLSLARFGLRALRSAEGVATALFDGPRGRALFAGLAGHAFLPLGHPTSAAFGLVFGAAAHTVGWPMARGGSQAIADALAGYLRSLGGEVETGIRVRTLRDVPPARSVLLDVSSASALGIAGGLVGPLVSRRTARFRPGPGVYKVDYALSEPVPWKAEGTERAGTVHLGGTLEEIAESEAQVAAGAHPDKPYMLVAQQSLADPARAPEGGHTLWAYCHVPNGSTVDMSRAIETQLERFAPGFEDVVLARHTMTSADLEAYNANYVGGDISGGAHDGLQLFARPRLALMPYRLARPTSVRPGIYLCSSSTPPGGGVHGMCGFHAAGTALRDLGRAGRRLT
jgi:phytoene dehydrogenase-like protein